MAVNDLTVQTLDKDGLNILTSGTDILENVQGTGTTPDGDRWVNTDKTFLILHADGHDAAVTFTIEPLNQSSVNNESFGALTVSNITVELSASDSTPQTEVVKIPVGYNNTSGKCIVKATSDTFEAGEVQIAAVKLADIG